VPGSAPEPQLGGWKAYRLEMKPFTAQTLASEQRQRDLARWKRDTFKLLNAHRDSVGRDPIYPPLRGKADAAQSYSEFAFATGYSGHMVGEFGSTYRTYNDRAAKLGSAAIEYPGWAANYTMGEAAAYYGGDILVTFAQGFEAVYNDATGNPVRRVIQPYYEISPTLAVESWLDSTRHRAYIEWDGYDIGGPWLTASFMSLGYTTGNAAAVFVKEAQWIQSGNRFWHSMHSEVPTVSWRGFQSENLNYETWPMRFSHERQGAEGSYTYHTVKSLRFGFTRGVETTTFPPAGGMQLTGTSGYTFGPASPYAEHHFPDGIPTAHYLSGEIYARGQVIAIAPDSGLVLAAAITKVADGLYRLLALCHHREDEPEDETNEGATRYLRFWYADLPADDPIIFGRDGREASLKVHARTVIRKKFGQENSVDPGPWNEVGQVNSWKGGQLIDVGTTGRFSAPDLTKYDCLWRFDNDGKRAICIRSSFHPDWFASLTHGELHGRDTPDGPWVPAPPYGQMLLIQWRERTRTVSLGNNMRNFYGIDPNAFGGLYIDLPCGEPIICRLGFSHSAGGSTATFTWSKHGQGTGRDRFLFEATPPLFTKYEGFNDPNAVSFRPIVAYYGEDGSERALYDVSSSLRGHLRYPPIYDPMVELDYTVGVGAQGAALFRGLVRGPANLSVGAARSLLSQVQLFTGDVELSPQQVWCHEPVVFYVDDDDLAFGLAGIAAPVTYYGGFNPFQEFPSWFNPAYAPHPVPGTQVVDGPSPHFINPIGAIPDPTRPIWRYALWHNDRQVYFTAEGNPYPDYPHASMSLPAGSSGSLYNYWDGGALFIGFIQQLLVCGSFQGGFAKDRNGEWVYGVTLCRQPAGVIRRYQDSNPFPGNAATALWVQEFIDPPGFAYYIDLRFMASFQGAGRPENFGGYIEASFASQGQLASLMQIPGENVRSFYARVV
jgi:hypothetical protein